LSPPDADVIKPLVRSDGEPAFEEPWQAQILALAFALAEKGTFTQSDWSAALGAELRRRVAAGEPDSRGTYYAAALSALEALVIRTGLTDGSALDGRSEQWRRAYLNTPHGKPVEL
jgi:nitrile hydratase accessory protein